MRRALQAKFVSSLERLFSHAAFASSPNPDAVHIGLEQHCPSANNTQVMGIVSACQAVYYRQLHWQPFSRLTC